MLEYIPYDIEVNEDTNPVPGKVYANFIDKEKSGKHVVILVRCVRGRTFDILGQFDLSKQFQDLMEEKGKIPKAADEWGGFDSWIKSVTHEKVTFEKEIIDYFKFTEEALDSEPEYEEPLWDEEDSDWEDKSDTVDEYCE